MHNASLREGTGLEIAGGVNYKLNWGRSQSRENCHVISSGAMAVGSWQFGLTKGCSIVQSSRFQRTTAGRWALAARFLVQMICRTAGAIGIKATARHILRQLWRGRLTAIATAVFPLSDHKDLLRVATNTRRAAGRSHPRVLIAGVLQLPQCARYRVWQKKGYFDHLGVDCSVLDWSSILTVRSALQTHTHVIFYRVPGYPAVLDLIKEAQELGLNAFWEADDLIFDRDAMLASRNLNFLEPRIRTGLVAGVPLYRAALQACGRGIASTAALAEAMCEAGARDVSVIENALDLFCEVFTRCRSRQHVTVYALSHKAADATNVSSDLVHGEITRAGDVSAFVIERIVSEMQDDDVRIFEVLREPLGADQHL